MAYQAPTGSGYGTAGQVLTDNGTGLLPSWQAGGGGGGNPSQIFKVSKQASTQTVTSGNQDTIVFEDDSTNNDFQVGTGYSTVTSIYTCPVAGYYFITATVSAVGGSTNDVALIVKNSAQLANYQVTSSTVYQDCVFSVLTQLNVGDTIKVQYYCAGGSATIANGYQNTYFCMSLLQSGNASQAWKDITSGSANMSANNGYTANFGTLCTLTLPTTAAYGSIIEVVGKGVGGWQIAQNANQMIHINGATSTTGTGGYLSSNDRYNSVKLLCTVANLEFTVLSSEGTLNLN